MKRLLVLTLLLTLAFWGSSGAQVLYDFETDAQGWFDNGWGAGLTGVTQVADPSGLSAGVLSVGYNIDADKKGVLEFPTTDATTGKLITYHVWLPADFPSGVDFELWFQDNVNWAWSGGYTIFKSQNIPKGVWYPLTTDIVALAINHPNCDLTVNKIGKGGIQLGAWGVSGADTAWAGTFYVDNVELIGAAPTYFAQFETDASGWFDNGWGAGLTGVTQVADPSGLSAGVLSVGYDIGADKKGVLEFPSTDATKASIISYSVWLPADFPNGVDFELWFQDNVNWAWSGGYTIFKSQNIPKEVWYPLTTDIVALAINHPNCNLTVNKIGKGGIQLGAWGVSGADTAWAGTFYIDNAALLSSDLGNVWLLADFENPAAGVQGFNLAAWGPAGISITRVADPSERSEGVLQLNHDYSAAPSGSKKSFISKDGIVLNSTETGTHVERITIDVWIPSDLPTSSVFEMVINGAATIPAWTWTPFAYTSAEYVLGEWNTFEINLQALIDSSKADPTKTATIGVQLYSNAEETWSGAIYFDDLILYGIPKPQGALASPTTIVTAASATVPGGTGTANYVSFDWVDNTLGTEKYNIYMSTAPFSNIHADGVVKYAANIPHGLEAYAHRPYTSDGSTQTYYYAITATDGVEETGYAEAASGSVSTPTTPTWKIKYAADFANTFSLDGLDNEFEPYKAEFQITPETGSYANGDPWAPGGDDLDFKVTMVMDADYLYVSGDVTDDDLRDVEGGFQAWQGDALELYMGFYNILDLDELHQKGDNIGTNGDWRISFTSMGDIQLSGYIPADVPGLEAVVFAKFTGDGYIVEAKFNLDSLAGGSFQVIDGMWLPFKIDNTDMDPQLGGDDARTLICGVGSIPAGLDLDQDWLRPHCWGVLEVVDGPTGIQDPLNRPFTFKLYNNYPNPFNPVTTIMYEIPKKTMVKVRVYDVMGREVAMLVSKEQSAGLYTVNFDASKYASGVYIYKITTDDFAATKKMMLLK